MLKFSSQLFQSREYFELQGVSAWQLSPTQTTVLAADSSHSEYWKRAHSARNLTTQHMDKTKQNKTHAILKTQNQTLPKHNVQWKHFNKSFALENCHAGCWLQPHHIVKRDQTENKNGRAPFITTLLTVSQFIKEVALGWRLVLRHFLMSTMPCLFFSWCQHIVKQCHEFIVQLLYTGLHWPSVAQFLTHVFLPSARMLTFWWRITNIFKNGLPEKIDWPNRQIPGKPSPNCLLNILNTIRALTVRSNFRQYWGPPLFAPVQRRFGEAKQAAGCRWFWMFLEGNCHKYKINGREGAKKSPNFNMTVSLKQNFWVGCVTFFVVGFSQNDSFKVELEPFFFFFLNFF